MKIYSTFDEVKIDPQLGVLGSAVQRALALEERGTPVLRWGVVAANGEQAVVEYALASERIGPAWLTEGNAEKGESSGKQCTALVVPTGVGARIGGFIADAGPLALAIESMSDVSIIHPNVVNGADFYGAGNKSLYTDGLSLDRFFAGQLRFAPPTRRKIGLLIEELPSADMNRIMNSANAIRAIHGLDIVGYAVTGKLNANVIKSKRGHYTGEVGNAEALLEGADKLRSAGANAIAVVTACGGTDATDWHAHYAEAGPNPVGTLEALISRYLTRVTGIPTAHAPAYHGPIGEFDGIADPRAAGEIASGTGLPCILLGLARSPLTVTQGGTGVRDLTSIIVPYGCAGGMPAWAAAKYDIPLVAIRSNTCLVGVTADNLDSRLRPIIVENCAEALGFLACQRAGVAWSSMHGIPQPISQIK